MSRFGDLRKGVTKTPAIETPVVDTTPSSVEEPPRPEEEVADAVSALRPVIPLQFITTRLAFMVQGKDYGGVSQMLRDSIEKEEWTSDGNWVCVVSVPGGMKNDIIDKVASRSSDVEVRELD